MFEDLIMSRGEVKMVQRAKLTSVKTRKAVPLRKRATVYINPKAPFNFDATVYKPSHFPSPDNIWTKGKYWFTLNSKGIVYGIKMENVGKTGLPKVRLTVYCGSPVKKAQLAELVEEARWRYDMDIDLREFYKELKLDDIIGPVLRKWRGMRVSCQYSLYELLVVTIVLQNATVRRSVQLTESLLQRDGSLVEFDRIRLYAFWEPSRLSGVTEREIRQLKVGYRARFIKKISKAFARKEIDEARLRQLAKEEAKSELLGLYGVGPASVSILLFESLHHYDAFDHLSPWEQKIYSRLLFRRDLVPAEKILREMELRWGRWRMLAADYLFEDLFWKSKAGGVPWLENLIRL